jgi:hypothetical protein
VHPDHPIGRHPAKLRGDCGTDVAALGAVAVVAQPPHQRRPRLGDPRGAPPGVGGRSGEAEPRQRRDHQVEGVGRVAPVGARVGERADDVQELHDRARPAVGHDQWQCVRLGGADVEEVDALPVDGSGELRELVEPFLGGAPIVAGAPALAVSVTGGSLLHGPELTGNGLFRSRILE